MATSSISQTLKQWIERTPRSSSEDGAVWSAKSREEIQALLLDELDKMTVLDLKGTGAVEGEIEALGIALQQRSFPGLGTLKLRDCRLDARGISELAQAVIAGYLTNLSVLDFSGSSLDDYGAQELARMLESGMLLSLRSLHLQWIDVGDSGLVAIASALLSGAVVDLRSLSIGSWKQEFTRTGTHALAKTFHLMPQLEDLLVQGIVDSKGVTAIVDELNSGMIGKIKTLELTYCGIGLPGAKAIGEALESLNFAALESLDLSNNLHDWMGDDGVVALTKSFKSIILYKLKRLVLNNVAMGQKGLLQLAALMENDDLPGLKELHLQASANTETSARSLVQAYQNNPFLVTEIFVQWPCPSWRNNADGFRKRNVKSVETLKLLLDEPSVPATHAKIFICGHPKVGKTTLKTSFSKPQQQQGLIRVNCSCMPTKIETEDQGNEIEFARRVHKNICLGVWDLAGPSELQLLHSQFLPNLAFARHGQATLFIVVCSNNYFPGASENRAKKDLGYWLRYISSNSIKVNNSSEQMNKAEGKRHVLLVLNSFHGAHECTNRENWEAELLRCQKVFEDFLELHPVPFIINAHNRKEAKNFKHLLSKRIQGLLLSSKPIPRICSELEQQISQWSKLKSHKKYPILCWSEFISNFGTNFGDGEKLRAATQYLHEAGHVIYFREGILQGLLESVVVLDPAWFCETIVGRLLLPETSLKNGETSLRKSLHPNGALPVKFLQGHYSDILANRAQIQEVISMLVPLGLAYRLGTDVFIPALLESDNVPGYWRGEARASPNNKEWVMGFALEVANSATALLPVALFRKLQMNLAQDHEFGGLSDSEYFAGKNLVTFKNKEMAVAVEYGEDPLNRLDVMTKALVDMGDDKKRQLNLAQVILEKFKRIANDFSPGIEFSKKVIEPWCSEDGLSRSMEHRKVETSVEGLKLLLQKEGINEVSTSMVVGDEPVYAIQILSCKDLKDLWLQTKEECDVIEHTIRHPEQFALTPPETSSSSSDSHLDSNCTVTEKKEAKRSEKLQRLFSRKMDDDVFEQGRYNTDDSDDVKRGLKDVKGKLQRELDRRKELHTKLQALVSYSVSIENSTMPRFLYLAHEDDGSCSKWMTLEAALFLRQNCRVHFLCEANFYDHVVHEVKGQEGIELRHLQNLGDELGPLLEWSLKISFVTSKLACNDTLPGLGLLLSDESTAISKLTSTGQLARISGQLINSAFAASRGMTGLQRASIGTESPQTQITSARRKVASVREQVSVAFQAFLANMTTIERTQKLGLELVTLPNEMNAWVCNDCHMKYRTSSKS